MPNNRGARSVKRTESYHENRLAWVQLPNQQAVVYREPVDDDEGTSIHAGIDAMTLVFYRGGRIGMTLPLTNYTRHELDALRKVIEMAFDQAAPLVDELDRRAEQARALGDDSLVRLYRPIPTVHVRERVQPADPPGVPE